MVEFYALYTTSYQSAIVSIAESLPFSSYLTLKNIVTFNLGSGSLNVIGVRTFR